MPSWGDEYTNDFGGGAPAPADSALPVDVPAAPSEPENAASAAPGPDAGPAVAGTAPLPAADPSEPVETPPSANRTPARKRPRPSLSARRRGTRVVGLKIGASQIAAATVVNNGAPHLVHVARTDLEPGVVVGGEVRDPETLGVALKDFFKKNKLPKRNVRLGISTNRVGVRTFELPAIADRKQLDNAVRFRAQEVLPVPVHDAVLDYRVLDEGPAPAEGTKRVLVVVTYRELVDRYVAACRGAGIQLVGIDLEAFALLRALGAPRAVEAGPPAAVVAVSVGHDRSTLAVSDGTICDFTRVLEWGGANVNAEIARALNVAPSAADPIKRLVGLAGDATPDGLSAEQAATARQAIRQQVHALAGELVSSLRFYQEQPGSLGISEIVVSGGTVHLAGFAEELQRLLNVPVRAGDPLARVRIGKKVKTDVQTGSLAVAIGLGIED
jgi:type IV pilus assembly protein PilM